jgi:quercetin 2,3-dioxygenase
MGNVHTISQNDVQIMSAGTGIQHSEFNKNKDKTVNFLQIWMFPNKKNVKPRYDQITFDPTKRKNKLQQILSPHPDDDGVWAHQKAWFYLSDLDKGKQMDYVLNESNNGVYIFVLSGNITVNQQSIETRDGIGIWETDKIQITGDSSSSFLLMEVPMSLS